MGILGLLWLLTLIAFSLESPGTPRTTHVSHEKRASSGRWKRTDRIDPEAIIPLRIGLMQTNLEYGHDRLMDVSHPSSSNYGRYLSAEEVHELFSPAEHVVQAIKDWLVSENINGSHIVHSENKGWLAVDLPAREVERLFLTEYHVLENLRGDLVSVGCEEYSVPAHLTGYIDYIRPGVKMSPPLKKKRTELPTKRSMARKPTGKLHQPRSEPHSGTLYERSWLKQAETGGDSIGNHVCVPANITPSCIRALYQIPQGRLATPGYELGLFEQGSYYDADDLNEFFANFAPWVPQGTAPKIESIDGGTAPVVCHSSSNRCGESDIDNDLAIALVYPQQVINYQVDDKFYAPKEIALDNLFNTFLDALDGSYCNYTAYGITGDSPGIDPTYPDGHKLKGFKGQRACGTLTPTKVISMSYGESEEDFPKNYARRQCNEFMKLGLQGHSIFVSSGDFGVGIFPGDPPGSIGCLSNSKEGMNETIFNPDYPGDCPYITVVGGTMLPLNGSRTEEQTMHVPEVAIHFSSGGGFSNLYPVPGYQKAAVDAYFENYDPGYPYYYADAAGTNFGENGGVYARGGRGMPDVSANGAWLLGPISGHVYHNFGTSLSSPIFAAIINLINEERAQVGKGPVGFINPVLYANAGVLNDITKGRNPNCGTEGFPAVPGWDPSTGLGTPNYPKLLELFMSLP